MNVETLIADIAASAAYANEQDAVVRNAMLDEYVEQHWAALVKYYGTDDESEVFEYLKEAVDVAAGICIILS